MKKKVLILGATGEISGRVTRLAVDAGHDVVAVARGASKSRGPDISDVNLIKGDKTDESFLRKLARENDFDVVIDTVPWMGAYARYLRCFPDVGNFFFCGSTGKFVPLHVFPADEDHPWREETATNFFNQSTMDIEILDCEKSRGTVLSPTNIIGENAPPLELWGGRDPEFFRMLKRNEPVVIPPCLDTLIQSGYNWDLASAFVKALDHLDVVRGQNYIISCRRATTLRVYLQTAMDFLGSKSEIVVVSPEDLTRLRPGVRIRHGLDFLLEHMCFSVAKAERDFGYDPKFTTEQGLIKALEWCEENGII